MGDPRDIRAFAGRERRSTNFLTINTQQDKMLEQLQRSLSAEKVYALKAMDGDQNIIRARHQKFKNKVAKIKSHLTEEEIIEFKKKDSITSRTSQSHIGFSSKTVASGGRWSDKHRSRSASGRLQTRRTVTVIETVVNENQVANKKRMPRPVLVKHQQVYSPVSVSRSDSFSEEDIPLPKSSATRGEINKNKNSNVAFKHARPNKSQSGVRSRQPTPKSLSRFSCHEISTDEDVKLSSARTPQHKPTPMQHEISAEEKVRLEFRQLLLDRNEKRLEKVQERTNDFLQKVSYDMQREKREQEERERQVARQRAEELEAIRQNSNAAKLERLRGEIRKKKQDRMKTGHDGVHEDMLERKEGESEEEYKDRMEVWREEMKRIRYLRTDDEKQGLSDVVTLVSAGMAANKIWREGLAHDLI